MRKFISFKYLIAFIILCNSLAHAESEKKFFDLLKDNDKLIWLRHFSAPGTSDPDNFDVRIRKTQRNLGSKGIEQGIKLSNLFKKHKIKIKESLSSQWFRAIETCAFFDEFKTFNALNSTFDVKFSGDPVKQKKDLQNYIKEWNGKGNVLLCSHYVILQEHLGYGASSGEAVITDKNLKVLGTFKP